ncbi:ATP-binding cassette domain-containing protein [Salinispirillum sp. LH 10-3-1]|uniref:Probable ATP-binding protein YheS n=1 Tax=Salinispirillum sp. LH 10-3-1 TaxID=2952525 RepID=A0AB38YGC0_9GAMM
MIQLSDIQLLRSGKILLNNATARIPPGEKVAIIGPNGAGKSSLFQLLLGKLTADQGVLDIPARWRVAHMQQETPGLNRSAVDHVLDGLTEWRALQDEIAVAEAAEDTDQLAILHGRMDDLQGYQVRHEAERILLGLGFSVAQLDATVASFSGGWRVRLNLAQTLIQRSELLLLDEPTNHLDLETVHWLQGWLRQYEGTLLLISHDRDFIDAVVGQVISFEGQQLITYRGNYSAYERQKAERQAQQQAAYEKQQERRADMERFVARFRAQATKARQAQSRLKALERMADLAPAQVDSPFRFTFTAGQKVSSPLLALSNLALGYGDHAVLQQVNLNLYPGMRIGLLGKNGAGKSTFIKHLSGTLSAMAGESTRGAHYYPGYFAQHQVDALDHGATPLQHIMRLSPEAREQQARDFLGGFNFQGTMADDLVGPMSGGEKARLALALIAWLSPNILLLDEPTNHLDLDMRAALANALQAYQGVVVVVSHDRFLMEATVDEFWLVRDGTVLPYSGDLDSYLQELSAPELRASTDQKGTTPATDRKAAKRQEAEDRQRRAPLKKAVDKAIQQLEKVQAELNRVTECLADADLYDGSRQAELQDLLKQQGELTKTLEEAEARWMEAEEAYEQS